MSKGRKITANTHASEWETVFYNSVGIYVKIISALLANEYSFEPLSNHIKIIGGYAFKSSDYKNTGVPIVRISDFSNEKIILTDPIYYDEIDELERYQLYENDIIIALTGGTIAKLAIVQGGLGKLYLNQRVGKFKVLNPDEFELEYVYWIARSIQSTIKELAWGAAIPNVSPKDIENIKFVFPEKQVQKAIVKFLNDLKNNCIVPDKFYFNVDIENSIITLQNNQIDHRQLSSQLTHQLDLVKKLRQQLLQDAVQGKLVEQDPNDEPASILLQKIKAEKEQLIKDKKLKKDKKLPLIKAEEMPFDIPDSWVWCRGEIMAQYIDPQPSHRTPLESIDGVPYIAMSDISKEGTLDFSSARKVSFDTLKEHQNRYTLELGDFIFGKVGTIGKPVRLTAPFNYTLSANLILIKPNRVIVNPDYLFFYLSSPTAETILKDNKSNMSYPVFGMGKARNMLIPLPPIEEQTRIIKNIKGLMQTCDALEASIKQSQQQNEQLLQQVLREALSKEVEVG